MVKFSSKSGVKIGSYRRIKVGLNERTRENKEKTGGNKIKDKVLGVRKD